MLRVSGSGKLIVTESTVRGRMAAISQDNKAHIDRDDALIIERISLRLRGRSE